MKKSLTVALVLVMVLALGIAASGCRRTTPSPSPTLMPSPTMQPSPTMMPSPTIEESPAATMEISPSPSPVTSPETTPAATEAPTGSGESNNQSAQSDNPGKSEQNAAVATPDNSSQSVAVTATVAQRISDAIIKLDGIQSVTVVLSNGTCLAGITLLDGTQWNNTLMDSIRRTAMENDDSIVKTAITADKALVDQIKSIADDVKDKKDKAVIATAYDALVKQIGVQ